MGRQGHIFFLYFCVSLMFAVGTSYQLLLPSQPPPTTQSNTFTASSKPLAPASAVNWFSIKTEQLHKWGFKIRIKLAYVVLDLQGWGLGLLLMNHQDLRGQWAGQADVWPGQNPP